ncbi:hypothetical protein T01_16201 [Trichinella spiralis]|uniref:Uncharacterized protein n=1 Tax=Trichinella spiralis TaxID=6334 RepID=A0A0V1BFU4_TRISP|nr:hypothetical protein T01_16201 [Trichinella spiralis]
MHLNELESVFLDNNGSDCLKTCPAIICPWQLVWLFRVIRGLPFACLVFSVFLYGRLWLIAYYVTRKMNVDVKVKFTVQL